MEGIPPNLVSNSERTISDLLSASFDTLQEQGGPLSDLSDEQLCKIFSSFDDVATVNDDAATDIDDGTLFASFIIFQLLESKELWHELSEDQICQVLQAFDDDSREQAIFSTNDDGETLLHRACHAETTKVVKYLVQNVKDPAHLISHLAKKHGTALHRAVRLDIVKILVEQLSMTKLEELLMLVDICEATALHKAVKYSRYDIVEYLLSLDVNRDSLVFKYAVIGGTVLHIAKDKKMAELIINAVDPNKIESLIAVVRNGETALHIACIHRRIDVVRYLLSLDIDKNRLLSITSSSYGTAVHCARSKELVEILITAISARYLPAVLRQVDFMGETAIHKASFYGEMDIIEYLTTLDCMDEEIICVSGERGTALHHTTLTELAQALVSRVSDSKIEEFMFAVNGYGETALHQACAKGRADLTCYLLTVNVDIDKLIFVHSFTDDYGGKGGTALHSSFSREVAMELLKSISRPLRWAFLSAINSDGDTALHTACAREKIGLLVYLLSLDANEYDITMEITEGSILVPRDIIPVTETFGTSPPAMKQEYLFPEGSAELHIDELLTMPNKFGNTPLMIGIEKGSTGVVRPILKYLEQRAVDIESFLQHRNNNGENSFHLAGRSMMFEEYTDILSEFLSGIDFSAILVQDHFGNTPLHYIAGMSNIKLFAGLIMRVSLTKRRSLLDETNVNHIDCQLIAEKLESTQSKDGKSGFFLEAILNRSDQISLKHYYKSVLGYRYAFREIKDSLSVSFDPLLRKVIMYAKLQYSLTSSASASLLAPPAEDSPEPKQEFIWQLDNDQSCLIIDDDMLDDDSRRSVMSKVLKLDTPEMESKPKIVIRRKTDKKLKLAPPSTDYVIITVTETRSEQPTIRWIDDALPTSNLGELLASLRVMENVEKVSVNSTLSKHMGQIAWQDEYTLITGENRGKALVLCDTISREDWEDQHNNIHVLLTHQLGLQVTCLHDLSTNEKLEEIEKFASSPGHGQMVALVIMSHGNEQGDMRDEDYVPLTVQSAIDALCVEQLDSTPKMVLPSFCRGSTEPVYNRVYNSSEVQVLAKLVQSSSFSPVNIPITKKGKRDELRAHRLPDIEIPPDCYLCFTTLPTSKSFRDNIMFREMKTYIRQHVAEAMKTSGLGHHRDLTHSNELSSSCNAQTQDQAETKNKDELCPPTALEIIKLFTDVAGIVREKSDWRIYTNHCFSVNRASNMVYIDTLPTEDITEDMICCDYDHSN